MFFFFQAWKFIFSFSKFSRVCRNPIFIEIQALATVKTDEHRLLVLIINQAFKTSVSYLTFEWEILILARSLSEKQTSHLMYQDEKPRQRLAILAKLPKLTILKYYEFEYQMFQ